VGDLSKSIITAIAFIIDFWYYGGVNEEKRKRNKIGSVEQKILLLLGGGLLLSLSRKPDQYFRILKGITKEWKRINERVLHLSIKRLYKSKLIRCIEAKNGMIKLVLDEEGKNKILEYNLDKMKIKKPKKWDGLWRIVIFDIPERFKKGRDALASRLKRLNFYPVQKSVFIYPYECKNEVDFIVEVFNLRPYVRFIMAKSTDIDLELEEKFDL
jgi:DNA-binding transcriptional regulator PaaX